MVYCGKPSKGCSNCRERKIRCDQREPGCGQCEKRQQQCPGYRNIVDLMFRDESSHVIKKAKAKQRKKSLSPDSASSPDDAESETSPWPTVINTPISTTTTPEPRGPATMATARTPSGSGLSLLTPNSATAPSSADSAQLVWAHDDSLLPSPGAGSWPATPNIAYMYTIPPTSQERGTAYFFSRYVTVDTNSCYQKFDFIYDVWKPSSPVPERQLDGVMASMTAVGLVGVANLTHSKEVMDAARKSYGTALRLTNAALKNPKEAIKDSTMLCVLILALFEMMTEPSLKTMRAWHEHVNGAAALAKMRGVSQFQTKAGVRMFIMLCQHVMITCLQKELPMSAALVSLRQELAKTLKAREPALEVSVPIYKVLQVRHDIKTGQLRDLDDVLERLNAIEDEFDRVIAAFPDAWRYQVFRIGRPHRAVFRDACHVYQSMWAATIWNGIRTCRALVLETILAELQRNFPNVELECIEPRYLDEFQKTRAKLERLIHAIIGSVPFHFGVLNPPSANSGNTLRPILTTEVREPPSPAVTSPASSISSSSSWEDMFQEETVIDDGGPTLTDPTRAKDAEQEAVRFMVLASATNTLVWPLYSVGMSSLCSPALKAYVVDRLHAIYSELGLSQARTVAGIVKNRDVRTSQWMRLPLRPPCPPTTWM